MEELTARIDNAACNIVVGRIGWKGQQPPSGWAVQLTCGPVKVPDMLADRETADPAEPQSPERAFKIQLPAAPLDAGAPVVLSAVRDGTSQELARSRLSDLAGAIDFIDADGFVSGWAVCKDEAPAGLELVIDGERACTMLADRYYPDLSRERAAFVGFRTRMPDRHLGAASRSPTVSLRHLRTERVVFTSPLGALRTARRTVTRGRLPVDVAAQGGFDTVFDAIAVDHYFDAYGVEVFIETAYRYLLERSSDAPGMRMFLARFEAGQFEPREVLREMYYSEERRLKGAFLGPFADDPGYPFALPRGEGAIAGSESAPKLAAAGLSQWRVRLAAERDALEAECAQLAAAARELKRKNIPGALALAMPMRPPRRLNLGRFMLRWGGRALMLEPRRSPAARRAVALADRARDSRDWASAAQLYRQALDRVRRDPAIWVQYGHALKETGQFAEAEAAYRRALALEPANSDICLQLGHVLKLQGKKQTAISYYLKAIGIDPSSYHAALELLSLGWDTTEVLSAVASENGR